MKIGLITAMESEYKRFIPLQKESSLKDKTIVLHQCGIGKVNAAMNAFDFIVKQHPDIVISTGVAGGCSDELNITDTVFAQSVCYHDVWCGQPNALGQIQGMPDKYCAPKEVLNKIKAENFPNVHFGLTVSGDWFVDSADKMREIKKSFPDAMAVDMESAAIAQVCYTMNVPFVSLRVISDIPLKENNYQQYKDFWNVIADNSFDTAKKVILSL
ncbi:MAG: 5'-methylthioadenosine/S-adenosylhomocysteine nucleosidase [Bacteroidales bacterium]|nr:5'-methylthioadenosine/S-adenosylhomocysteine nucleosidase [Bacteroidales bacterium]